MNDSFEKFVRSNQDKFDFREPDPGLWKRIAADIRPVRKIHWRLILSRAAMVAVIFAASYGINEFVHQVRDGKSGTLGTQPPGKGNNIPGLQEAEAYYTGLVNEKMDELKPIISHCPSLEEELNVDLSELDRVYLELKGDLKDNMANQEVIEAIIENYRMKVSILEHLLKEINPLNDECISTPADFAL
ncbi:MAG TPA: hypothetical protein VJ203_09220 [Bacteroidales bacterium]|nr:hypothetical protein [Bacteroidales bacterium]